MTVFTGLGALFINTSLKKKAEASHTRLLLDSCAAIRPKVKAAEIPVAGTPIWLREESSICRVLIERLHAMFGDLNGKGQSISDGKVGGCVMTGNEDGIKHTAMTIGLRPEPPRIHHAAPGRSRMDR